MDSETTKGRRRAAARPTAAATAAASPTTNTRTGRVDLGVLVPSDWLGAHGIDRGASIGCEELPDGSLLLRARRDELPTRSCVVEVTPEAPLEHVFRQLVAAYLAGAEEFVLLERGGLHPATLELARTFARRTARPEIVAEGRERLVLRNAPEGGAPSLLEELRRMYRFVTGLEETVGEYLAATESVDPTTLARRDDDVDRQAWLVERRLGRTVVGASASLDPVPQTLLLARALERIGDHAVTIGSCAAQLSERPVPDGVRAALRAYHQQAVDYLHDAFEVAEAPDVVRANELLDLGDALHAAHATLTESLLVRATSLSPVAAASVGLLLQSIDRTAAYAQDIAQVGLDRAIATRIALGSAAVEGRPAPPTASAPLPRATVGDGADDRDGSGRGLLAPAS